jgi:aconitate hydratase
VRAVIAESFERIHRANLVGMGVLPLQFKEGDSAERLDLTGRGVYTIEVPPAGALAPRQEIRVSVAHEDGTSQSFSVISRLDTPIDVRYYVNGGILQTVLRDLLR